jgi:hypothetical protein
MGVSGRSRFSVFDFVKFFSLRNQNGEPYLLIGGQAVNYWAERYRTVESDLERLLPFVSVDIDFKGTRDDVTNIAKIIGRKAIYPLPIEMTALAGAIPIKVAGGLDSVIEVVRMIPGVSESELAPVEVEISGERIRVIDPFSLCASKLELAYLTSQEQRQDVRHLKIALLAARAFLREILALIECGEVKPDGWLGAVNRMRKLALSKRGVRIAIEHQVDWSFLPVEEIALAKNEKIKSFRAIQMVRWGA